LQEVLARDAGRAQAKLMLAFIDGSLPPTERGQVCEALRTVVGGTTTIDACQADAP